MKIYNRGTATVLAFNVCARSISGHVFVVRRSALIAASLAKPNALDSLGTSPSGDILTSKCVHILKHYAYICE